MTKPKPITLGVLALQGAFREHVDYFNKVIISAPDHYDITVIEVRTEQQLASCDSLVIPGGESTSMSLIAERTHLFEPLLRFVADESKSIWGTCAGLIFLAKHLKNGKQNQRVLGAFDIEVTRNAFGRQLDSFEQPLDFSSFIPGVHDFPTVFIRAPVITKILSEKDLSETPPDTIVATENLQVSLEPIEVLHSLQRKDGRELIVAVRQGNRLGTSFHPELADDYRFHKWYIDEFVMRSLK